LREGAIAAGCPQDRIVCVPSEEEATDICLRAAMPGDLVLVLPTKVETIWQRIVDFRPEFAPPPHQHPRHEAEKALHV
jgi:cyanophycin synthetase